ncbi:MAG: flagellar hook-length control protein FliK [Planctomycetaceae bacterium]|nr:flagellar hook-length control protein FliK [Planctomycetaceae bacterium]
MAISNSGQAPVTVEFSDAGGRAESSSRQSRALNASDTRDTRPAGKARPEHDDEFSDVLAGLLLANGKPFQPNPALEKTETTTISAVDDSAGELAPLVGPGQSGTASGTSEQQSVGTSLAAPGDLQNSAGNTEASAGLAGTEGFDAQPSTVDVLIEGSLNSTVPGNSGQPSSFFPALLPPQVPQVGAKAAEAGGPEDASPNRQGLETEISLIQSSASAGIDSESFADHKLLSPDALDRIGQLTGEKIPEVVTPVVSGPLPTTSVFNKIATAGVADSELATTPGSAATPPVPALRLTAVTQFGLSKSPLSAAVSASKLSGQTVDLVKTTQPETTDSDGESEQQLISTPLEFGSALGAEESRPLSVAEGSAGASAVNLRNAAYQERQALGLQSSELEISAGSGLFGRASVPASTVPVEGAKPGPVVARSEATPDEAAPLYVANTFSEVGTSLSLTSDLRHTLSGQVSQAVLQHIEHTGVRSQDSLTIRLDPPELGEMRIELSKTADGLAVRVTACEALTMDMLLARGQEIESQLRSQQMDLKSLEFVRTDLSQQGFSQGQGQQQQQSHASGRAGNLLNQIRGGARNTGPAGTTAARNAASESAYGLSFRA